MKIFAQQVMIVTSRTQISKCIYNCETQFKATIQDVLEYDIDSNTTSFDQVKSLHIVNLRNCKIV